MNTFMCLASWHHSQKKGVASDSVSCGGVNRENERNGGAEPTRIPGWSLKCCVCVCVWFGALRLSITHICSFLLSYLQFLLGVLQGLWVFIQLIFSSLQFLLHLNQLILMLGERKEGNMTVEEIEREGERNIIGMKSSAIHPHTYPHAPITSASSWHKATLSSVFLPTFLGWWAQICSLTKQ